MYTLRVEVVRILLGLQNYVRYFAMSLGVNGITMVRRTSVSAGVITIVVKVTVTRAVASMGPSLILPYSLDRVLQKLSHLLQLH